MRDRKQDGEPDIKAAKALTDLAIEFAAHAAGFRCRLPDGVALDARAVTRAGRAVSPKAPVLRLC